MEFYRHCGLLKSDDPKAQCFIDDALASAEARGSAHMRKRILDNLGLDLASIAKLEGEGKQQRIQQRRLALLGVAQ